MPNPGRSNHIISPSRFKKLLVEFYGPEDFIKECVTELGVDQATVYRWLAGKQRVPGPVVAWAKAKEQARAK